MNNMPNPNVSQMQNIQNQRRTQQIPNSNIPNMPLDFSQQYNNNFMPPQNSMPGTGNVVDNFLNNGNSNGMVNQRYISAMLERYISKIVKIEFLVGNTLNDRVGRLLSVGEDYIVLGMLESKIIMICNTEDLKFATVILDEENTDIEF